jgi:glycosyltransferase involved in cell wall biosynthesis
MMTGEADISRLAPATSAPPLRIAVVLPCHNEEASIAEVVAAFRATLPHARIYVVDNACTDRTAARAHEAGATVITQPLRGKGNAVWRAFAEIDADVYVMADGDGTYDAARASDMVRLIVADHLDMVVGIRISTSAEAYRRGHRAGNRIFTAAVAILFGQRFTDIFSGYRAMSRRFVKSFPAVSEGFEIETELTVHALQLRLPTAELATVYCARAAGTASKLRTFRDGLNILWRLVSFARQYTPLTLYSAIAAVLALLSLGLAAPVVVEFLRTGLVPRLPTALLSTGIMLLAMLSFVTGIILHNLSRMQAEIKRLHYLATDQGPRNRTPQ